MSRTELVTLKAKEEEMKGKSESSWRDIMAGGISGGLTRMLIAPLDVIKIRFQVQTNPLLKSVEPTTKYHYTSIADSVRTILREEGVLAFWNGNLLAELLYIAYVAAQFGTYAFFHDSLLKLLPEEKRASSHAQVSFISGGAAAFTAITLTYPLDLLRTRFAAQAQPRTYQTIPEACRLIYRTDGWRGFYSGWGPTCLSLVPSMAVQFALYDWAKRTWFGGRESANPLVHVVAGGFSGIISKLAVLPLDVLKKRLQIHGLYHHRDHLKRLRHATSSHTSPSPSNTPSQTPHFRAKPTMINAIKHIHRYEGFKGFFRGAVASALKAGVSASLTFTFYEQSKIVLLRLFRQMEH